MLPVSGSHAAAAVAAAAAVLILDGVGKRLIDHTACFDVSGFLGSIYGRLDVA